MNVSLGMPSIRTESVADRAAHTQNTLERRAHDAPTSGPLADTFGRTGTDLRVSLTDLCNLRCTYCMPASGMTFLPKDAVLTAAEVVRLVRVAVDVLGVRELRLTGGEPLLRQDLAHIVASIRDNHPNLPIAMTTNAIGLEKHLPALHKAGLNRINVSLDTVDPATFAQLSRRTKFSEVMAGLNAALRLRDQTAGGSAPFGVKINSVLMRGVNDHQAVDLAQFGIDHGVTVRFIEQMPLDADHGWTRQNMVTAHDIATQLQQRWELRPRAGRGSAPAELFDLVDSSGVAGQVGIIASVTRPFCSACTRTRITAEGKIRSCLFSHEEFDLAALLRSGASDDQIAQAWRQAMWLKPKAHGMGKAGLDSDAYEQPNRSMSAIGG